MDGSWQPGKMVFHLAVGLRLFVISAVTSILFVIAFFYTYTGVFGIESLVLDIISLFLALVLGQMEALRYLRRGKAGPFAVFVSLLVFLLLAAAFVVFTFAPPHIPLLFLDGPTGTYGI